MRLKNVKGAKERINKSKYIIIEPINLDLQKLFGNNNDVQLEIGTGKGDFLIEMARRNPNINFLGIEKYDSVLVRAIEKIDELELSNIYFIREDAMEIDKILKNAEVVVDEDTDSSVINVGCTVKIKELEFNEEMEYKIVGSTEANSLQGKISNESPVGKALIGAQKGDTVEVETPAGMIKYMILDFHKN